MRCISAESFPCFSGGGAAADVGQAALAGDAHGAVRRQLRLGAPTLLPPDIPIRLALQDLMWNSVRGALSPGRAFEGLPMAEKDAQADWLGRLMGVAKPKCHKMRNRR